MTEGEVPDRFYSDKHTMTSSVKIVKILFFRCICSLDENFRPEPFFIDSGLISFNLMHHVTFSNIQGRNWSF